MTFKEYRTKEGFTQAELAEKCKCSIQQIQKIEQDPEKIYKVSTGLMLTIYFELDPNGETEFCNFINEIYRDGWNEKRKK